MLQVATTTQLISESILSNQKVVLWWDRGQGCVGHVADFQNNFLDEDPLRWEYRDFQIQFSYIIGLPYQDVLRLGWSKISIFSLLYIYT